MPRAATNVRAQNGSANAVAANQAAAANPPAAPRPAAPKPAAPKPAAPKPAAKPLAGGKRAAKPAPAAPAAAAATKPATAAPAGAAAAKPATAAPADTKSHTDAPAAATRATAARTAARSNTAARAAKPAATKPAAKRAAAPAAEKPRRLGRLSGRAKAAKRQPGVAKPRPATPPRRLDDAVVAAGIRELTDRGVSDALAQRLIALAGAHCAVFFDGDLRAAARTSLTAELPAPPPLPVSGAAVAIVGAGGAGKTRAAAALASAYGLRSTLPVTVVAIGDPEATEIGELLRDYGDVHVTGAVDAARAAEAITAGRANGLVVIDTEAAGPRDADAVEALAAELDVLALDAVYVALPATLSARAGASLLEGLAPLSPTAIVVTHADETDDLGVAIELSRGSGIPIAYLHEGLDLDRALSVADPPILAAWLLP
jgi:flagellar biosynthesis GTPase FlhF